MVILLRLPLPIEPRTHIPRLPQQRLDPEHSNTLDLTGPFRLESHLASGCHFGLRGFVEDAALFGILAACCFVCLVLGAGAAVPLRVLQVAEGVSGVTRWGGDGEIGRERRTGNTLWLGLGNRDGD